MGALSVFVWMNLPCDNGLDSGLQLDFIQCHTLQGSEEVICANQHNGNFGCPFWHLAIQQAPPQVPNVVTCSQDFASSACQHLFMIVCVPSACDATYKSLLNNKVH